jgi:hypothetical protein
VGWSGGPIKTLSAIEQYLPIVAFSQIVPLQMYECRPILHFLLIIVYPTKTGGSTIISKDTAVGTLENTPFLLSAYFLKSENS